ncbi:MAG: hypothetical protein AAGI30_07935 [Planctomycetota bacterium]
MRGVNEHTTLCERCGYDLSAAKVERCPECGLDADLSDPTRRVGSALQRWPGDPRAWAADLVGMALRPKAFWSRVRVESHRSAWLLAANGALAAIMLVVPIGSSARFGATVFGIANSLVVAWVAFSMLSAIEYAGLRVFGRRRGWRVTHSVSIAVTGHTSAAWVVGAALASVGFYLGQIPPAQPIHPSLWSPNSPIPPAAATWEFVLPVVGWMVGFVVFETWTYAGWRAMRFANRA